MREQGDKSASSTADPGSGKSRPVFGAERGSVSRAEGGEARLPPRVVRIPPSETKPAPYWGFAIVIVLCCIAGNAISNEITQSRWSVIWFMLVPVVVIAAVIPWDRRRARRKNEARDRWLARHAAELDDPMSRAVVDFWKSIWKRHDLLKTEARLRGLPEYEQDRAVLIVVGDLEVPESGDYRFEPEIVSPFGRNITILRSPYIWFNVGAAIFGAGMEWVLYRMGGNLHGLIIRVASLMFILGLLSWILFRPTYYRFAPGMIQWLSYPWLGGKPKIRSYPMGAGTIGLILNNRHLGSLVLQLKRGTNRDLFKIVQVGRTQDVIEGMWQALLSTAETPPLSEEELVG